MKLFDYVFQDTRLRYKDNGALKTLLRYFRIPSFKLLVNYRLTQYINRKIGGGITLSISRLRLERLNSKYLVHLDDKLECGSGLSFPHNGPFVINGSAKIGTFCTIHPNVLIGGDRGKGSPIIGDYVFIGNGAKIIGKVKVGDWCFITPGAIVTKDIPSGSLVGCGLNNILSDYGRHHVELYL